MKNVDTRKRILICGELKHRAKPAMWFATERYYQQPEGSLDYIMRFRPQGKAECQQPSPAICMAAILSVHLLFLCSVCPSIISMPPR